MTADKTVEEQIRDAYQFQKENIFPELEPDSDPLPMMYHISDKTSIVGLAVEGGGTNVVAAINMMTDQLGPAKILVYFSAAWAVKREPGAPKPNLPPSMCVDRVEVMNYVAVDMLNAATGAAPIIRTKDGAPTLGELEVSTEGVSGRFVEALRRGVR